MEFLLHWQPVFSFLFVSIVSTMLAVSGLYLVRKKYPAEVLKENHEVAAIIFNAFGLLYGVIVAFTVFVTWTGYDDATKNLQLEADAAIDISHSAKAFPEPARTVIQQGLIGYLNSVYSDELDRMSRGDISIYSADSLRKLIEVFNGMDEKSAPNRELYMESLKRLSDLAEHRRLRIFAGNNSVPLTVWFVLLGGGVISVTYTYLFGTKNIKAQYLMISALTATTASILFLIYILDHPFTGASKVSTKPLSEALGVTQNLMSNAALQ